MSSGRAAASVWDRRPLAGATRVESWRRATLPHDQVRPSGRPSMKRRTLLGSMVGALAAGGRVTRARAQTQDLTVALGASVTSIDPHFHNLAPNSNVAFHIFGSLVGQDPRQR